MYVAAKYGQCANNNSDGSLKRSRGDVCHRYLPYGNSTCAYLRSHHAENNLYGESASLRADRYYRGLHLRSYHFLRYILSSRRPSSSRHLSRSTFVLLSSLVVHLAFPVPRTYVYDLSCMTEKPLRSARRGSTGWKIIWRVDARIEYVLHRRAP